MVFAPKLVHVTRCVTRDRLTLVLYCFWRAFMLYDVVLLRINRLVTTSNRPEQMV